MRCVCSSRVIPFSKRTKKLCAYKRYNYIVLSARFWMTANPATACAVLVRVFTDTLTVVCLRGLNPFLPIPRGSPVTIEPHMRNASTFPRPVQSNRTTHDNSVIARGKAVFNSRSPHRVKYHARPPSIEGKAVHSNPPALYRGKSGTR